MNELSEEALEVAKKYCQTMGLAYDKFSPHLALIFLDGYEAAIRNQILEQSERLGVENE